MAKIDHVPFFVRGLSPLLTRLLGLGLRLGPSALLTVRGRITGRTRTIPVALLERNGHRWLVAIFGEVSWVRNLRAAGEGILTRGRRPQAVVAAELAPEGAGRVLKDAVGPLPPSRLLAAFLRRYVKVTPDTSTEGFVAKARQHPVFELRTSAHALNADSNGESSAAQPGPLDRKLDALGPGHGRPLIDTE